MKIISYIICFLLGLTLCLGQSAISNEKHKVVIFKDWILDLDELDLISVADSFNIVWDVEKVLEEKKIEAERLAKLEQLIKDTTSTKDQLVLEITWSIYTAQTVVYDDKGRKLEVSLINRDKGFGGQKHIARPNSISLTDLDSSRALWEHQPEEYLFYSYADQIECIVHQNMLIVLVYYSSATMSHVFCLDLETGEEIWIGDIKQLKVEHSKYKHQVYMKLIDHKIVIVGDESYGKYIQIVDPENGSNLFTIMKRE